MAARPAGRWRIAGYTVGCLQRGESMRRKIAWRPLRGAVPAAGLALALTAVSAAARPLDWARVLLLEQHGQAPIPVLSYYEPELDLDYAYAVQSAYVRRAHSPRPDEGVMGVLAGPGDRYVRERYGVPEDALLMGRLLRSWRLPNGSAVVLQPLRQPMLANALGYRLGCFLGAPPATLAALQRCVTAIVPVVLVLDLGFGAEAAPGPADLVAANLGTRYLIVGQALPPDADVEALVVNLAREGKGLNWVRSEAVPGGQWHTLLALVREALARGERLEPGRLLITGALGRLVPAEAGRWSADYQAAGRVEFELR